MNLRSTLVRKVPGPPGMAICALVSKPLAGDWVLLVVRLVASATALGGVRGFKEHSDAKH